MTKTKTPAINAKAVPIVKPAKLPNACPFALARQRGYEDKRQGKPFADDFDAMPRKEQYAYERGRTQATLAAIARPGKPLPAWPVDRHIRPILYSFLGMAKATKLFEETSVGRSSRDPAKKKKRKGGKRAPRLSDRAEVIRHPADGAPMYAAIVRPPVRRRRRRLSAEAEVLMMEGMQR